ncbi:helix-turn-helix domain-containing protein [Candidatus Pacearchaeota archaeon]|nr:helix-turn-helix domain-containing protein [Candidatus Pacearchaeota archaeon]
MSDNLSESLDSTVENIPVYYTTGQAAKYLSLSAHKITELFENGYLEGFCIPRGGHRRISYKSLKELKEKMKRDSGEDNTDKFSSDTYTTGEVSRICNLSPQTITRYFNGGTLRGYRVPDSSHRRIPHKNLVDFMIEYGIPQDRLRIFLEKKKSRISKKQQPENRRD